MNGNVVSSKFYNSANGQPTTKSDFVIVVSFGPFGDFSNYGNIRARNINCKRKYKIK